MGRFTVTPRAMALPKKNMSMAKEVAPSNPGATIKGPSAATTSTTSNPGAVPGVKAQTTVVKPGSVKPPVVKSGIGGMNVGRYKASVRTRPAGR